MSKWTVQNRVEPESTPTPPYWTDWTILHYMGRFSVPSNSFAVHSSNASDSIWGSQNLLTGLKMT